MVMPSILDLSDPPSAPPCGAFRPPPARSARALPTRCQVLDHLGDVLAERGPRILLVQGLACQHRRIRGGPIIAEDEVGGDSDEPVEDLAPTTDRTLCPSRAASTSDRSAVPTKTSMRAPSPVPK